MKCLLIHLSDIHFNSENDSIISKKEAFINSIRNEAINKDIVFILVTGDIAYSGTSEQYKIATTFFNDIESQLISYAGTPVKYIFIPGNHDCCHDMENEKIRQLIIKQILSGEQIDSSFIRICCSVQENFFRFTNSYNGLDIKYEDEFLKICEYKKEDFNITFNCYNTGWISQKHEQPGKLYYPIDRYDRKLFIHESDLVISMFHHPYSWFIPENKRKFDEHTYRTSDIILTGHEHESSVCCISDLYNNTTEYIEGSVFQDSDNKDNSGFNLINIDLVKKTQQICKFMWDNGIFVMKENSKTLSYKRSDNMQKRVFQLNERFEGYINDPGATFAHPYKSSLKLNDIYVFPDLLDIDDIKADNHYEKSVSNVIKSSEHLCRLDDKKILILGTEKSGKTALSKMLFRAYYNNGYTPVLIEGNKIRETTVESFEKLISDCYCGEYIDTNMNQIKQLDNDNQVIIIDSFEKIKLNSKYISLLFNNIGALYNNFVIIGSDIMQFEEIVRKREQAVSPFYDFKKYKILELGYYLRAKLIERWNILGREESIVDGELIRINDNAEKIINTIIGKNFIPAYPIFLLTILQTIEAGKPHDLKESSYGYYYQFLITQALSKINILHDEIDAYNSFLTDLSNYFFEQGVNEVSRSEFVDFHKYFCSEYKVSTSFQAFINPDILINSLSEVSIIEYSNGSIKFRYKYIFYYYIAKYMSDNISNKKILGRISLLCKKLHMEEYANIFIFLVHHSKSPYILEEVLLNAMLVFDEFAPIKLENDIKAVNDLIDEVPKLILENRDVKKNREDRLKRKDEQEYDNMIQKVDNSNSEAAITKEEADADVQELDVASKLNYAFKVMGILGQILKNYWGSMKGDKRIELAEEVYFIGLRALNSFYSTLSESKDYIVNQIESVIERKGITDRQDIEKRSKRVLFRICNDISYLFIKKISDSIGYEKLSETFGDILLRNDMASVKLIDTAIKLNYYKNFPFEDIKKLKKELGDNISSYFLLRRMVIEYLYMFQTSFKEKHKICELLDIPIKAQLAIDHVSSVKKES